MIKIKNLIDHTLPVVMLLLACFCIYCAFIGATRTGDIFESLPMTLLCVMLMVILAFRCLICLTGHQEPGFLMMCLGTLLILFGFLLGSETVFQWWSHRTGSKLPFEGYLVLDGTEPRAALMRVTGGVPGYLPFKVSLKSFEVQLYSSPELRRIPPGTEDSKPPLRYYSAEISIIENGKNVAGGKVRINRPLRHNAYHFYLHSHDHRLNGGNLVTFYVRTARGLRTVYTGLVLLMFGLSWWAWAEPLMGRCVERKSTTCY